MIYSSQQHFTYVLSVVLCIVLRPETRQRLATHITHYSCSHVLVLFQAKKVILL